MLAGALLNIYCQHPSIAQAKAANETGPVVYATKNILAGSIICVSDVGKNEIDQAKLPAKALPSPLLVVGYKAKNNLVKDQVIFSQDIDFHPQLTEKEQMIAKEQVKIARAKWTSASDAYWYNWAQRPKSCQSKITDQ